MRCGVMDREVVGERSDLEERSAVFMEDCDSRGFPSHISFVLLTPQSQLLPIVLSNKEHTDSQKCRETIFSLFPPPSPLL